MAGVGLLRSPSEARLLRNPPALTKLLWRAAMRRGLGLAERREGCREGGRILRLQGAGLLTSPAAKA
eukprot:5813330-Pyramimonas_sp.AAC.1